MCINVHAKDARFWSIGLLRVHGSVPAEKCINLLQGRLADFGLSLSDDIVCIVTDGASVMVKVAKLITADQQLCFAHGIQLAVLDVLYRPKQHTVRPRIGDDTDEESSDDKDHDNDHNDMNESAENEDDTGIIAKLSDNYQAVVNKVRTIVKIFKRSTTIDAVLQKFIRMENEGRECVLMLDCRTRWSSLFNMLSTF
jgi:hypothetical protein